MANVQIKIMGVDPITKSMLVACCVDTSRTPVYKHVQYAFPANFGGATNGDEFLENIKEPCIAIAKQQELIELNTIDGTDWVDSTLTCDSEIVEPIVTLTDAQKLALVYVERDKRLFASDWTMLPDVMSLHNSDWVNSWKLYRQELRDLPTSIDVNNPVYPVPPM